MKITQLVILGHEIPYGTFNLADETTKLEIKLLPEESIIILNMCYDIFEGRQERIAKNISEMKQARLTGPNIQDAEFDEVPF